MTFTFRLLGAIWISALVVIGGFTLLQIREERQRLTHDLARRAALLGDGVKEAVEPAVDRNSLPRIERILNKFATRRQAIAVYDTFARLVMRAPASTSSLPGALPEVANALVAGTVQAGPRRVNGRTLYVYAAPLEREDHPIGVLVVVLDASRLDGVAWPLWRSNGVRFFVLALVISLFTFFVVRGNLTHPIKKMAEWTRAVRTGSPLPPPEAADATIFGSLALEVSGLATSLSRARAAATQEAALRLNNDPLWTEERLKQFVNLHLGGRRLFMVSNREPISHVWKTGRIQALTPASGLVSALQPAMLACGGVWVAHASGDADSSVVDRRGRLKVPGDDPRYTLRRVWLSSEEEDGYYYGFANEGLWPLCHIAHTRPLFRPSDWAYYRAVNEKFAAALLDEMEGIEAPRVLVQDYHFALLPALIKAKRPDSRVAIFWHIPWPNLEAFSICPWREEILLGMLGGDLIGFNTQYYCNNFLETVEHVIEARVDWEHFSVFRGQHASYVKPFPISVAPEFVDDSPAISRESLLKRLRISPEFLGVGVERLDYTKGLPERFQALQRFFERYPEYLGRVVFVQLAAPSRNKIKRYRELDAQLEATIQTLNLTLQTASWRPILYLKGQHGHSEIWPFYRAADFCMVTSLHDGMNLVAKEFVAARSDEDGVLILSRFTGAARELRDGLLVNPYDLDEMAEAIRAAVEMPAGERRTRMNRMRRVVREHNIYRWTGLLLSDLSRIPEEVLTAELAAERFLEADSPERVGKKLSVDGAKGQRRFSDIVP